MMDLTRMRTFPSLSLTKFSLHAVVPTKLDVYADMCELGEQIFYLQITFDNNLKVISKYGTNTLWSTKAVHGQSMSKFPDLFRSSNGLAYGEHESLVT